MRTKLLTRLVWTAICLAFGTGAAEAQKLYVPNYNDGTVSEIDIATNTISDTISVSGAGSAPGCSSATTTCPEGVAVDGTEVYISLHFNDRIAVIDTASANAVSYIPVPHRYDPLIAYEPVKNRVYVSSCAYDPISNGFFDDERLVAIVDPVAGSLLDTVETTGGVWGMAFSPDAKYLYGVKCGEIGTDPPESVLRINIDSADVNYKSIDYIVTSKTVNGIGVSPDGTVALVSGSDCLVRLDLVALTESGTTCGFSFSWFGVSFSADGSRAYATDDGTNELVVIDPNTAGNPTELTRTLINSSGWASTVKAVGTRAFVLTCCGGLDGTVTEAVEFDITSDVVSQGCSLAVGSGGFDLDVKGAGDWYCPTTPPDGGSRRVHGEGRIAPKVEFEVEAHAVKNLKRGLLFDGHCHVNDHSAGKPYRRIRCLNVTSLVVVGNTATIEGDALDNGLPTQYRIDVADIGKKGRGQDTFAISTASGYVNAGVLTEGNIKFKD
ncbi:MAG: YncE family protein [Acidobacteria bacterium]|nr:YncE family protein [Acidobacteriota bacterium]